MRNKIFKLLTVIMLTSNIVYAEEVPKIVKPERLRERPPMIPIEEPVKETPEPIQPPTENKPEPVEEIKQEPEVKQDKEVGTNKETKINRTIKETIKEKPIKSKLIPIEEPQETQEENFWTFESRERQANEQNGEIEGTEDLDTIEDKNKSEQDEMIKLRKEIRDKVEKERLQEEKEKKTNEINPIDKMKRVRKFKFGINGKVKAVAFDKTPYRNLSPIYIEDNGARKQYITKAEVAEILFSNIEMDIRKSLSPYEDLNGTIYDYPAYTIAQNNFLLPNNPLEFGLLDKLTWGELLMINRKIDVAKSNSIFKCWHDQFNKLEDALRIPMQTNKLPTKTIVVRDLEHKMFQGRDIIKETQERRKEIEQTNTNAKQTNTNAEQTNTNQQ